MGDEVKTFESDSPTGILDYLREGNFCASSDDSEFLRDVASLANTWSGDTFRYNSKESFAEDMMSSGMMQEITDDKR